ncbi:MAG: ATP-binding protein [Ancalomicrobiaceae bacterium]|nr:ATP-binding protein [Ancalomicrobiaceae bacterium]
MNRLVSLLPGTIASQLAVLMVLAAVMFNVMLAVSFSVEHMVSDRLWPNRFQFEPCEPPPGPGFGPERRQPDAQPDIRSDTPESGLHLGEPRQAGTNCLRRPPPRGLLPFPSGPIILGTMAFLTATIVVLGIWAARALIAPLKDFIEAAERFSATDDGTRLEETVGPAEIRALARALNAMQARIGILVGDRTKMLAAVGHDLRTPITRLRLRAEFMEDDSERRRMLADLDHMEALVQGALMHLRDGKTGEETVAADLPSLLQAISDHFADLGHEVPLSAPPRLVLRMRPHEIQRAITNLVENAVRYGKDAHVELNRTAKGDVVIQIIDSGPGIVESEAEELFEAFRRGNAARTMNEAEGFGLGLSIARAIAEGHGGSLDLIGREPSGVVAQFVLPGSLVADRGPAV